MIAIISGLTKPRITIASTLTAAVGYVLARGNIDLNIIPVLIGGFLLAAGSAALNQVQEADIDSKVERTKKRPIPSGSISKTNAFIVSSVLIAIGFVILNIFYGFVVGIVGLSAALLYNGVYTPLKKISPFAAVPGAVIGAIPPLVGWLAAEGLMIDPRIYYLCFFYFIWQIPHFWLLLLFFGDQYKKNDLPSLFDRFSENIIKRLTFSGILATSATGILLPSFLFIKPQIVGALLSLFGAIVLIRSLSLLTNNNYHSNTIYRVRFMDINIYALLVTILVIVTNIL